MSFFFFPHIPYFETLTESLPVGWFKKKNQEVSWQRTLKVHVSSRRVGGSYKPNKITLQLDDNQQKSMHLWNLWEMGHILARPTGWAETKVISPLTSARSIYPGVHRKASVGGFKCFFWANLKGVYNCLISNVRPNQWLIVANLSSRLQNVWQI